MLNTPFSPWPSYSEEEIDAVASVLRSNKVNYWTGNYCKEFETAFAAWVGVDHAIALANGTIALELALEALGVGPGDDVIVTARSFFASASSIIRVGANPIFADVDLDSQNITAATIEAVLTSKTKAIICVHLAGWPCEMDEIMSLAHKHQLYVIEDCAQAHGAKYKGQPVGSFGHIAAWSFCQDKIITTGGEGGMITTNNEVLYDKIWSLKDHGKSRQLIKSPHLTTGFRWVHESFGSNYRMTEMQAVIGLCQLKKIEVWHKKRLTYASKIWHHIDNLNGFRCPTIPSHIEHAAYKCYIFIERNASNPDWNQENIIKSMSDFSVPCYTGSCPEIYLEKAFENTNNQQRHHRLPNAMQLGETSLMLLVHPTLTEDEINKTCATLETIHTTISTTTI